MHLWSRGEELITHRFPEIAAAATRLPDGTVLDGEVLAFRDERPLPFSALQQRIGRQKQVAQLARAVPVVFMTYDVLEDRRRGHPRPLPLARAARDASRSRLEPAPQVEHGRSAGVLRLVAALVTRRARGRSSRRSAPTRGHAASKA